MIKYLLDRTLLIDMLCLNELIYGYKKSNKCTRYSQLLEHTLPNGRLVEYIENKYDLQAGVTISDKYQRIVVVFCGSESLKDFVQDIKINKIQLNDKIKVHAGFYQQLISSYDDLELIVKRQLQDHQCYQLYTTGHSLGGALATLYGYLLSSKIDQLITVVTFGSPRVGNYYFADAFSKQPNLIHYRITNNRDIITALPIFNYYHTGNHIILKNHCIQSDSYSYRSSILHSWRIDDHLLSNYFKNII